MGVRGKLEAQKNLFKSIINPITLIIPCTVFRYIMTLARGYGCEVTVSGNGKKIDIAIEKKASPRKIFCPSPFSAQNYLHKRKFNKADSKYHYIGRSSKVVTRNTPITLHYNMTTNRVTLTAFIQRYTEKILPSIVSYKNS